MDLRAVPRFNFSFGVLIGGATGLTGKHHSFTATVAAAEGERLAADEEPAKLFGSAISSLLN